MKKILKSLLAVVLAATLSLQLSGCGLIPAAILIFGRGCGGETIEPPIEIFYDREDIPFSSLSYERPDTDAIRNDIGALTEKIQSGAGADEVLEDYAAIMASYDHLDTMASLAYILYSKDVTEEYYDDEYTYLTAEANELDLLLTDLSILMYETDGIGEAFLDAYGPDFKASVYKGLQRNSPEVQEELNLFTEMSSEYDTALSTFRMVYNGKEYSEEDLINSYDGDANEYMRKVDAYYEQMNEQIGPLYLEMVRNNVKIAEKLGYSTFTEYQYEGYDRDYSPEDAKKVQQAVKDYLVPVYTDAYTRFYYYSDASGYADSTSISYSSFMQKFSAALSDFAPDMLPALEYIQKNKWIDLEESEDKMKTNYTIYLADQALPFIFMQWSDKVDNCSTVIHEFGHYSHYFLNPHYGWSVSDPLDIDEIDSQGLELLMLKNYETFFGSRKADGLRAEKLLEAMYVIVAGCMEDEFQQTVYENPDMTLEELNELYARLAREYGLDEIYGYNGTEWVAIPHTFQSPLYYFSYAASMIVAVELWSLEQKSDSAAREAYLTIQYRDGNATLRALVEDCGLSDPISPETIYEITDALEHWMNEHF